MAFMAAGALAQAAGAALPADVQAALDGKNWQAAVDLLKPLVASSPRWEYEEALGKAEINLGAYSDGLSSLEAGVASARRDQAASSAIARMLILEGNAQLKLHDNDAAIADYSQAAAVDPHSAASWDLCATNYNIGRTEAALAACDAAIAIDPSRADAYFVKGSLLVAGANIVDGKLVAPVGAREALNMYLQLAPGGPHAADVKAMLDYLK